MKIPRYSPPTLFFKLPENHQKKIVNGFKFYYMNNALNPKPYKDTQLDKKIITHFKTYNQTTIIDDAELTKLLHCYVIIELNEDVLSEIYPEYFV